MSFPLAFFFPKKASIDLKDLKALIDWQTFPCDIWSQIFTSFSMCVPLTLGCVPLVSVLKSFGYGKLIGDFLH